MCGCNNPATTLTGTPPDPTQHVNYARGMVLGQHALALTLMAAWATHLRLRLRVFSMVSQSLTIFALLTGYQFVLFWVDGATGNPVTTLSRWFAPIVGALLWPAVAGVLSRLHDA